MESIRSLGVMPPDRSRVRSKPGTLGSVAHARLERAALADWCREYLGGAREMNTIENVYFRQDVALRLAPCGDVVVKVRAWQERVATCAQVQHVLWERGFPTARLLVPPLPVGDFAVSAEALVRDGELLPARPDSA